MKTPKERGTTRPKLNKSVHAPGKTKRIEGIRVLKRKRASFPVGRPQLLSRGRVQQESRGFF